MGIFGTGPFDSDDAGESLDELYDGKKRSAPALVAYMAHVVRTKLRAVLDEKGGVSDHYLDARAVAQFAVLAHHLPPVLDVVRLLARMRSDVAWLSEWHRPKKIARALDEELASVLLTMRGHEDFRKAAALAKKASAVPVPLCKKVKSRPRLRDGCYTDR
jgi:hypothetical protein